MPTRKSKRGRPTSYLPEYAEQARKLCVLGAIDRDLAMFFDVDEATINRWKKAHNEFCESMRAGKMAADAKVAESLYQRAKGYEHSAVKIFADAKTGAVKEVPYTKRYPPDTPAAIFWLKNRRPEYWRDKQDHEVSGPNGGPIESSVVVNEKDAADAYMRMIKGAAKRR